MTLTLYAAGREVDTRQRTAGHVFGMTWRLRTANCQLRTRDSGRRAVRRGVRTANCEPRTANHQP